MKSWAEPIQKWEVDRKWSEGLGGARWEKWGWVGQDQLEPKSWRGTEVTWLATMKMQGKKMRYLGANSHMI